LAYLIDTNIAIHARDGTDAALAKLAEHDGEVLLSALSLAELQRGVHRDRSLTGLRQARLEVLLRGLPVLPFDASAAFAYGRIIASMRLGTRARLRSNDRRPCDQQPLRLGHEQLGRFQRYSGAVHRKLGGLGFAKLI